MYICRVTRDWLVKNSPEMLPCTFLSKLMHSFHREKNISIICATYVFKKKLLTITNQLHNGQKIVQSGHPANVQILPQPYILIKG
jgi:hypothetical protein